MTTQTMNTDETKLEKTELSKAKLFILKQWVQIKYAFSLERALIHLITAILLCGTAYLIKSSHEVAGDNRIYEALLLLGAAIQIFRSCVHSLTPVALLLIVGFGGQYLLSNHVDVYLCKQYLEYIAGAGLVGLVVCSLYRLR